MRVLMTSWAWPTHFFPLVPLGWALRTAGHEVHVAGQPALVPATTRSGHIAAPIGEDVDFSDLMAEFFRRSRERESSGQRPFELGDLRSKGAMMLKMFVTLAEAMTDGLVEYARAWRPDVIVYEPTTYAAPIAAAHLGIPTVRHLWGIDYTHQTHEYENEALADLRARYRLGELATLGDLTIDPCPPAAQITADYPRQPVRYVPYNGPGSYPDWLHTPPARRRICLTWGTSSTRLSDHLSFVNELARAAGAVDAEVVLAVSAADHALLADAIPPNVRVVEQLPLHLLLPTCDLVVHQGGMGTTMTAITQGVPQIIIPQLPDQIFNARQVEATGAAVRLDRGEAGAGDTLRVRIAEVLESATYRARAGELRDQANARPPLTDAVAAIERLAG